MQDAIAQAGVEQTASLFKRSALEIDLANSIQECSALSAELAVSREHCSLLQSKLVSSSTQPTIPDLQSQVINNP